MMTARIPQTNAFSENRQFFKQILFTSRPFNSAIVWYFPTKFADIYILVEYTISDFDQTVSEILIQ